MRIVNAIAAPLAGAAFMLAAATGALAASDPTGIWINDTGRGAIEIKPCGKALCGHVVWVKDASDTKGCRKQIIGDATPAGAGRWDSGWIYSPEKRKNYDVELTPLKNGTLRVLGYAGTKLFSRTMIWTKAPADLKRCDAIEAKAAPAQAPAIEIAKPATGAPAPVPPSTAEVKPAIAPDAAKPAETAAKAPAETPAVAKDQAPSTTLSTAPGATPAPETPEIATTESDDDSEGGEKPGERSSGGGIKLGDLDLDKVLTKSADGKCKLDLPWVKVKFNCNRE